MRMITACLAAAVAAGPAAAQQVSVASGDWSNIPEIEQRGMSRISVRAVDAITKAVEAGGCPAAARPKGVALSIPFLVEFAPSGEVRHIVLQNMSCPEVESLVGGALLQLAKEREYRATGENALGWYRGQFALEVR